MKTRQRFGQHFLKDQYSLHCLRSAIAPQRKDHIVEIGPGYGALTEYLIGSSQQLDLIEIDRDLVAVLQQKYNHQDTNQIRIYQNDALRFDFNQLLKLNVSKKLRIVGNLPYNISTPLLFHLFQDINIIQDMHFLLQSAVVDRLCAPCGTKNYGRLSIMTQFYCGAKALFTLPPEVFNPPPKVMSSCVRLVPHRTPPIVDSLPQLQSIVREAFNYRRKNLKNSLKRWISPKQLQALDIDPQKRPQQLSVQDYIRITNSVIIGLSHGRV